MTTKVQITRVNIYRNEGAWCYSAWADAEFDHSDVCDDAETRAEAETFVRNLWPDAEISEVSQ